MIETMRYLVYRLKRKLPWLAVMTVTTLIITLISVNDALHSHGYDETLDQVVEKPASGLGTLAAILVVMAIVIAVIELSEFKSRRNLDTLFFLPLRRDKMAIAVFLGGYIQWMIVYTVSFLASFIYINVYTDTLATAYMIPYYFLSLLLGLVIYAFICFFFNEGNTTIDGVVFCLVWCFIITLIVSQVAELIPTYRPVAYEPPLISEDVGLEIRPEDGSSIILGSDGKYYVEYNEAFMYTNRVRDWLSEAGEWMLIYAPVDRVTSYVQGLVEHNDIRANYRWEEIQDMWYMFVVWGVIGVACLVGFILRFAKKKTHLVGEISSTPFGYKTLIPVVGYTFILGNVRYGIGNVVVSIIGMAVAYIVYRRGVRFKKSDVIILICSLVPLIAGLLLSRLQS